MLKFLYLSASLGCSAISKNHSTADNFFITMCYMQRDWFDIHCSRVDSADPLYIPKSKFKVFTKDKKEIHLPESELKIFSDI